MPDTGDVRLRHKIDVHTYYRMGEAGIFQPDDRVELIEGELIDMAPIGDEHAAAVTALTKALVIACGDLAVVSVQCPVRLGHFSEPQPDFAVSRLRLPHRRRQHPAPPEVLLLVEVAESSLRFDRTVKLPIYAQAGIPEVWIVDLTRRVLESHQHPGADSYAKVVSYGPADTIALALAPEIALNLAGVFD